MASREVSNYFVCHYMKWSNSFDLLQVAYSPDPETSKIGDFSELTLTASG